MNYKNEVRSHHTTLEYGKFVEILDNRFPAVSTTRITYPEYSSMPPISTVEVYPKYAVLTYIANASDISGGGGSVTVDMTRANALLDSLTAQVSHLESLVNYLTGNAVGGGGAVGGGTSVYDWEAASVQVADEFVSFPPRPATSIKFINNTGVNLVIKRDVGLDEMVILNGVELEIELVSSTSELLLRRADFSITPVTIYAIVQQLATGSTISDWSLLPITFADFYMSFTSTPAKSITIFNSSNVDILVKRTGTTVSFPLPAFASLDLNLVADSSEVSLVRADGGPDPVTICAIASTY